MRLVLLFRRVIAFDLVEVVGRRMILLVCGVRIVRVCHGSARTIVYV